MSHMPFPVRPNPSIKVGDGSECVGRTMTRRQIGLAWSPGWARRAASGIEGKPPSDGRLMPPSPLGVTVY